jgi:hypothetical protein
MCTYSRSCTSTNEGSIAGMVVLCILLLGGGGIRVVGRRFIVTCSLD